MICLFIPKYPRPLSENTAVVYHALRPGWGLALQEPTAAACQTEVIRLSAPTLTPGILRGNQISSTIGAGVSEYYQVLGS